MKPARHAGSCHHCWDGHLQLHDQKVDIFVVLEHTLDAIHFALADQIVGRQARNGALARVVLGDHNHGNPGAVVLRLADIPNI